MDYNSHREPLKMPEYGRHIQKMVKNAAAIEDREERTAVTGHIIKVMGDLFPYLRDISEFKQKLYDHLAIMSDFTLDIDTEYTLPTEEALQVTIEPVPYPQHNIKLRYYGRKIEDMIKACVEVEDDAARMHMAKAIANQMKNAFINWNKKIVVDDKIFQDLKMLSDGALNYSEKDFKLLDNSAFINPKPTNTHKKSNTKKRKK